MVPLNIYAKLSKAEKAVIKEYIYTRASYMRLDCSKLFEY
jgi:hypothetical protein